MLEGENHAQRLLDECFEVGGYTGAVQSPRHWVRAGRKAKVERRNVRSKYNVVQLYEILPLESAKAQLKRRVRERMA